MRNIDEIELKPAIEKFYLDYAVSVITDRALPDARDGLKPVHRRTLYGANDLKIFSDSAFRKSAALVGHVMGDYHPHGDCVSGDTEFLLTDGTYKNIYDMYLESLEKPNIEYEVYSINTYGAVRKSILTHPRIGQRTKTIYELTLSNGSKIEVTSNHPIALANLEFIKTEELKIGDVLSTYPVAPEFYAPEDKTVFYLSCFGNNRKILKLTNIDDIPAELNQEACKLINGNYVIYIKDIKVIEREEPVDMYDFTVEGFENALIKINDNLLCIHNSAIYDATVLLAQPFATRYPLFEGQGNFGNIDGDGAAAYRYCLVGDTLVKMADGSLVDLKDIEQMHTEPGEFTELKDVYIVNKDLEKKQATHFYNSGVQDTIKITTNNRTITGTPNHPLVVFNFGDYEWKTLDSIKVGDLLVAVEFGDFTIGNYALDEVVSVEDAGKQQTYCLRVDCPSHSFIAGGFINHNTEIRLSPYGETMLDGVNNNVVPMVENYDGEHVEPTVLPAKIPNMIINGSSGIAVAMSTSMPPHNLTETINAIELIMKKTDASIDDILSVMPGPDFPLGGIIRELDGIREYYESGRGKFAVESKWSFERVGKHYNVYFTEIPYGVSKSKIVEKVAEVIDKELYKGIISVEDESNIEGIKIVVKAEEDVDIPDMVEFLFKKTPLSSNFNVINLALDTKGRPRIFTMRDLLDTYINHQVFVYENDAKNNIKALDKSIKIANALIKASSQIKKVVDIIEKSKDTATVKTKLKKLLDVDDESVNYILELQLRRIQKIEKKKQEEELKNLEAKRSEYQKRLDDKNHLNKVIISDLRGVANRLSDKRRTLITDAEIDAKITTENFKILYTPSELRMVDTDYHVTKADIREALGIISTDSGSITLVILNDGSAIALNNYTLTEKVKSIDNISCVISVNYNDADKNLYLFSKHGMSKAISMELLLDTISKKDTFEVMGLEDGDRVIAGFIDAGDSTAIAYNDGGRFIRASLSDVRPMGLSAKGVVFMKIDEGVSVIDVNNTRDKESLFYVKGDKITSVPLDTINSQGRAGQGRMLFDNSAAVPGMYQYELCVDNGKVLVKK